MAPDGKPGGVVSPGLSVVIAVREAGSAGASLQRWSTETAVDEVMAVDLGGTRRLIERGVLEIDKTVVVLAGGTAPWARGLALNIGVAAASRETILVVDDGDRLLGIGQYRDAIRSRGFLSGYGTEKIVASEIAMFRRSDWEIVGGFHEYLLGWGFEDEDLFNRLEDAGTMHRFFEAGDFGTEGPDAEQASGRVAVGSVTLPDGLTSQRWFQIDRNKILAGLAPWTAALALMRPRRFGRPAARVVSCDLAPRSLLERRLQECASYLAARFLHDAPESTAFPMLRGMIDERAGGYRTRAARQRQIDMAMAVERARGDVSDGAPLPVRDRRRR